MKEELVIIQGDYYGLEVTFESVVLELIDKVIFTSKELNICKELVYNDELGTWLFELSSNETKQLTDGHYDYDITIKFTNGENVTAIYNYGICVKEKENKVDCYE